MARCPRFVRTSKSTVYHVISRTALAGLPNTGGRHGLFAGAHQEMEQALLRGCAGVCHYNNISVTNKDLFGIKKVDLRSEFQSLPQGFLDPVSGKHLLLV